MPAYKETICKECGEPRDQTISSALCRICHRKKSTKATQKWRQSLSPEEKIACTIRANTLRLVQKLKIFNLTLEDFDLILAKQDHACAICKGKEPLGMGNWHIDHDHVTNKFRGLLCSNCNLALGCFHDSISTLENAINYLKITSAPAYDPSSLGL